MVTFRHLFVLTIKTRKENQDEIFKEAAKEVDAWIERMKFREQLRKIRDSVWFKDCQDRCKCLARPK